MENNCDGISTALTFKWYTKAQYKILNLEQPIERRQLNGSVLAYDLFILNEQNYLSDQLIKRLPVDSSFNGARYEIFAFATMIRAGFKLEPFDEPLGLGRVTECRATHTQTGAILQFHTFIHLCDTYK